MNNLEQIFTSFDQLKTMLACVICDLTITKVVVISSSYNKINLDKLILSYKKHVFYRKNDSLIRLTKTYLACQKIKFTALIMVDGTFSFELKKKIKHI